MWDSQEILDKLFACYHRLSAAAHRDIPIKQVWTIAEETGGD